MTKKQKQGSELEGLERQLGRIFDKARDIYEGGVEMVEEELKGEYEDRFLRRKNVVNFLNDFYEQNWNRYMGIESMCAEIRGVGIKENSNYQIPIFESKLDVLVNADSKEDLEGFLQKLTGILCQKMDSEIKLGMSNDGIYVEIYMKDEKQVLPEKQVFPLGNGLIKFKFTEESDYTLDLGRAIDTNECFLEFKKKVYEYTFDAIMKKMASYARHQAFLNMERQYVDRPLQ